MPNLSVLLVEDEVMIRMMLADMLEELGHRVAAEAGELQQALGLARSASFDLAILDINLDGVTSFPVADAVVERRLPLIFASGYSTGVLPANYSHAPRLQKPFSAHKLESAISQATRMPR